jgi:hypothetical protein
MMIIYRLISETEGGRWTSLDLMAAVELRERLDTWINQQIEELTPDG